MSVFVSLFAFGVFVAPLPILFLLPPVQSVIFPVIAVLFLQVAAVRVIFVVVPVVIVLVCAVIYPLPLLFPPILFLPVVVLPRSARHHRCWRAERRT